MTKKQSSTDKPASSDEPKKSVPTLIFKKGDFLKASKFGKGNVYKFGKISSVKFHTQHKGGS
ncbi:hypothetical protein ISR94_03590 [Candidatus Microgenomates bacterium]|nr:hypothetical protein [Candidatus Microgenomates bacterium]